MAFLQHLGPLKYSPFNSNLCCFRKVVWQVKVAARNPAMRNHLSFGEHLRAHKLLSRIFFHLSSIQWYAMGIMTTVLLFICKSCVSNRLTDSFKITQLLSRRAKIYNAILSPLHHNAGSYTNCEHMTSETHKKYAGGTIILHEWY